MPFRIAIFTFQGPPSNFEQPHCHPRPHLCQFYALIACPNKHMMSNFDTVFNVLESHNSVADFLICGRCFSRREEMLYYLHNSFAKGRVEVFKDQVRIRLANSAFASARDILPKEDIV